MIAIDSTTNLITGSILREVARLAWKGELEAGAEFIPESIVPGPLPQFRCCIYREREIVRQRVRLVRGLCPGKTDSGNIVQVIPAACDDCAISSYTVTDNCHGCLGHACFNACRFNAVSIVRDQGRFRAHIDPQKCRECGLCAKSCPYQVIVHQVRPCKLACPVNAITMNEETGLCQIDEKKCIQCGHCIHACPFGALGAKAFLVDVIQAIRAGKRVYAMLAPAAEGQFGPDITPDSWRDALKKAGFTDMLEVSLGGDLTAAAEAEEWAEAFEKGERKTTSCCPAFVNMIRAHFSALSECISTTASPMCGVSRLIKTHDAEAVTVFIGPCQAKKSEALDKTIAGSADFVLTFDEAVELLRGKGIELAPSPACTQQGSTFGKRFGNSAGVTAAVLQCLKEQNADAQGLSVKVCNGAQECKNALTLMKLGRLPEQFVEGMACEGGCVGGPARHKTLAELKKDRDAMIARADGRGVHENLRMMEAEKVPMER